MTVHELSLRCKLSLIVTPARARGTVARIFASNTMSDLVTNAASDTLLVTSLNNSQLVRIAELMDAPGICLVGGASPSPALMAGAERAGKAIAVSAAALEETRELLECALRGTGAAPR
jgi:hypothetical protein